MTDRFVRLADVADTFGDAVLLGMAMRDAEPGIDHPSLEIEPYAELDTDADTTRWRWTVTYYGATAEIDL